jgi:hypothetical protein
MFVNPKWNVARNGTGPSRPPGSLQYSENIAMLQYSLQYSISKNIVIMNRGQIIRNKCIEYAILIMKKR